MGEQVRLTKGQKKAASEAALWIDELDWSETADGFNYWERIHGKLNAMAKHGTTDGQPLRKPEAEANPESEPEQVADVVCVIDRAGNDAVYIDGVLKLADSTIHLGTLASEVAGKVIRLRQAEIEDNRGWTELLSDLSLPAEQSPESEPPIDAEFEVVAEPEPVIDDKWAAVYPRRWVMVRDTQFNPWVGPFRLFGVGDIGNDPWPYCTEQDGFAMCRPATAEEIASVEPQEAEPEKPEIGKGYREGTQDDSQRTDREMWNGECWLPARLGIVMDGETYRVPVVEVGEGYRPATESDKDRRDRDYWHIADLKWVAAPVGVHAGIDSYRVPIDREPTVEDAKDQPIVIAWCGNQNHAPGGRVRFLNRVDSPDHPFVCLTSYGVASFKHARHLRSYE